MGGGEERDGRRCDGCVKAAGGRRNLNEIDACIVKMV